MRFFLIFGFKVPTSGVIQIDVVPEIDVAEIVRRNDAIAVALGQSFGDDVVDEFVPRRQLLGQDHLLK